jgi:hypothetical protein
MEATQDTFVSVAIFVVVVKGVIVVKALHLGSGGALIPRMCRCRGGRAVLP